MLRRMVTHIRTTLQAHFDVLNQRVMHWTMPPRGGVVTGTVTDLTRSKAALIAENALLLSWPKSTSVRLQAARR